MVREKGVTDFLQELNIPLGVINRFEEIATMCGVLPSELMVRLIMRLYETSQETMRNLIDYTYEWEE